MVRGKRAALGSGSIAFPFLLGAFPFLLGAFPFLLGAIALLFVGLVLLRSGLSSLIHHRGSTDRVIISNKKT